MRKTTIGDRPVLVLREAKPIPPPAEHECAVYHGCYATREDYRSVIQCDCGKRYHCRKEWGSMIINYIWARRLLPWPPKQRWP